MSAVHWRAEVAKVSANSAPFAGARSLLHAMRATERPFRLLHVRRVPLPIVAFSRRDELNPGFAAAVAAAEDEGFASGVRPVGGTFAPLHEGSLVVDEYGYADPSRSDALTRFEQHSTILHEVFRGFGVAAEIGPVSGEYCPGLHSVNARGRVKLSGTAQRVAGGAWLLSSVVQIRGAEQLRAVTARCASALKQPVDSATIGSLEGEVGGLDAGRVARGIVSAYRRRGMLSAGGILGISHL